MSLREEQCRKVCRILDDVLANRPTERDSLILAVRKAFAEPKRGWWIEIINSRGVVVALRCSRCEKSPRHGVRSDFCPNCGAKMEVTE